MKRDELLTELAIVLEDWPEHGDMPPPNLPGLWSCHHGWRVQAKGDDNLIFGHDWLKRREEMTDNECTAEEDAAWAEKEAQLNGAKFEVVGEDWDGETWPPPIGAIIESFAASGYGVECEVLAVRDGHVIACALDTCVAGWINKEETRPIRTERERWLDQAGSIESCMPDSYQPYELLEALYDAGLARMPRAGHETP